MANYKPEPDVDHLKTVLRHGKADYVPLVELAIADEVLADIKGKPLIPPPGKPNPQQLRQWATDRVNLWHQLGYDYYRIRVDIPFQTEPILADDTARPAAGQRQWVNEHQGVIQTADDIERFHWPTRETIEFAPAEAVIQTLPEGMGAIGFSGGVFEWASTLLGLTNMMLKLHDEPELVRNVIDRVGQVIHEVFEVYCEMDEVFALWLGDDMGYKTSTLIRPEHLREYVLPWHAQYAELAHRTGRLFLLHSCGNIEAVMPDLVNDVKIDATHSFEDVIEPVESFHQRWGSQIAVLGGVDVDVLSRQSPEQVRRRTLDILETCAPGGSYACGSGNSITNYIPTENYLAMLKAVHGFNGYQ